jgi:hypothetical protein
MLWWVAICSDLCVCLVAIIFLVRKGLDRQWCFRWETLNSSNPTVLGWSWSETIVSHCRILHSVIWVWCSSFGWGCLWGLIFVSFVLLRFSVGDRHPNYCMGWVDVVVVLFYLLTCFHHLVFLCLIRQFLIFLV